MALQSITFNACVNGELRHVSIHEHTLTMNGFLINFEHDVCCVSLGKDVLFLVFTDNGWYGVLKNNISAYDFYTREHLYDIDAIVPKSESYIYADVLEASEDNFPYQGVIKGHQILSCDTGHTLYIIDLDEKRVIATFPSR